VFDKHSIGGELSHRGFGNLLAKLSVDLQQQSHELPVRFFIFEPPLVI
jgi:hypothetical protein